MTFEFLLSGNCLLKLLANDGKDMARYQYQARDGSGSLATGVIAAATTEEASQLLRKDGK